MSWIDQIDQNNKLKKNDRIKKQFSTEKENWIKYFRA